MSWTELLHAIHDMFTRKRNEVEAQAENLVHHLATTNMLGLQQEIKDEVFNEDNLALLQQPF